MFTECEIWDKVKLLKGKTIYTYIKNSPNNIEEVEDSGSEEDKVIIKNRQTMPQRQNIVIAYNRLYSQGTLNRISDLSWFANHRRVSSIIFRIVGEIAKDDLIINIKQDMTLILKKGTY